MSATADTTTEQTIWKSACEAAERRKQLVEKLDRLINEAGEAYNEVMREGRRLGAFTREAGGQSTNPNVDISRLFQAAMAKSGLPLAGKVAGDRSASTLPYIIAKADQFALEAIERSPSAGNRPVREEAR
jgi:hypothetical protein